MTTITIIGGGIAGLALASSLDPSRFDVTVVEQRDRLPVTGTSLAIWPEARAVLEQIGVFADLQARSPAIDHFPMRSASGVLWADMPTPAAALVARHDLLGALDAAVPASVHRTFAHVDRLDEPDPHGDAIVVGADGVHSAVRRAGWNGRADAAPTPYLAVRGVIADPASSDVMGEYWGRGRLYGVGPHREGTNWYASFRSDLGPRNVDVAEALDAARSVRPPEIAPALGAVLDAATVETTLAQRIMVAPRLRSYVSGRLVLVGDAAHAMTPNLGRGACEALVDAVTLARHLNALPPTAALAAYDRERVRSTRRLQAASALLMRAALAERTQPMRDRVIGIATARARRDRTPQTHAGAPTRAR